MSLLFTTTVSSHLNSTSTTTTKAATATTGGSLLMSLNNNNNNNLNSNSQIPIDDNDDDHLPRRSMKIGSSNNHDDNDDATGSRMNSHTTRSYQHAFHPRRQYQHLYVLPVLLLEFLALALTRAVLPSLLLEQYGSAVYLVMGFTEAVRGLLAFVACPIFGKVSDVIGRRTCLFVTVLGTCAPVCSLAFFQWDLVPVASPTVSHYHQHQHQHQHQPTSWSDLNTTLSSLHHQQQQQHGGSDNSRDPFWPVPWNSDSPNNSNSEESAQLHSMGAAAAAAATEIPIRLVQTHPHAITVFVILLSLSGLFSSTFTLVFAYISDTVHEQDERVSAYGLALATFGLSFTIGPMAGGYLAKSHIHYVFLCSLLLTIVDLLYIYFILPESRDLEQWQQSSSSQQQPNNNKNPSKNNNNKSSSNISFLTMDFNFSWSPVDTLRVILVDPFLRKVGQVAFFYYTGLWAIISTLSVYAVRRFHLSPERLGELMSALGLSTMIAEAVLVRILVPMLGEKRAMKVGLISFAIQCVVLGFAWRGWHLFVCAAFSMLANLVYPSLSSLVSGSVEPTAVGEALGAVNGIKALTEGIGPLVFGTLMTLSEHSSMPGWPYLLAALLVVAAYKAAEELPDVEEDDYIHELDVGRWRARERRKQQNNNNGDGGTGILMRNLFSSNNSSPVRRSLYDHGDYLQTAAGTNSDDEEYENLLSEVDEGDDAETAAAVETAPMHNNNNAGRISTTTTLQQQPP